MSGLCGAFRADLGAIPDDVIARMERSIEHRGRGPVRRLDLGLAVISCVGGELSDGEHDVSVVVDGIVLEGAGSGGPVPNGAAPEIRDRYLAEQDSFPSHLRGEFAIALWDETKRRGLLVRDPYGVRPLYVAQIDGGVLFASELRAILATGLVDTSLDYEAVEVYLDLNYVVAPRTLVAGVRKLRAGHMAAVETGRILSQRSHWSHPRPNPSAESPEEIEAVVLAALEDSVARQAAASEAPGVLLSAGLDSALVLALLVRHAHGPVVGLTVAVADQPSANELDGAARVAAEFGVKHVTATLRLDEPAVSLGEMAWLVDEPIADLSILGLAALSRAAADVVDVALTGTLADSLFSADVASRRLEAVAYLDQLPRVVRHAAGRRFGDRPGRAGNVARILGVDGPGDRYRVQFAMTDATRHRLLRGPLVELNGQVTRALLDDFAGDVDGHPTEVYSYVDQFINSDYVCHISDRAGAIGPIDIRYPFADPEVVEVASTVPGALRVRRGEPKLVLKRLARKLLPPSLLDRRKVGFFDTATEDWVRAQLGAGGAELLLDPGARTAEFIDPRELEREIQAALAGGPVSNLFPLLVLEGWLSLYLPRALGATA